MEVIILQGIDSTHKQSHGPNNMFLVTATRGNCF